MRDKRIIVGMSGGVDSAVAAFLLKQAGHEVEGLFMKNWEAENNDTHCPAALDLRDAENVCNTLDIPLHTVNFSSEYWQNVFSHFLAEYQKGRTPNPDILCNREIKFKVFLEYALSLGADCIATGHYAQKLTHSDNNHFTLLKAQDDNKDQSYFLYSLDQYMLSHAIFPIGHLTKPAVRQMAEKAGFSNHQKKDSTGICFIGERKFQHFLSQYLPLQPGNIETTEKVKIGEHSGLMFYTLGQRQGLGIGGLKNYKTADPIWYVVDKDLERNVLVVAQGKDHPRLYGNHVSADSLHWIAGVMPASEFTCTAKIRYRQPAQVCTVRMTETGCHVAFNDPQRAITPGQSIVFYEDNHCLGGGVIQ